MANLFTQNGAYAVFYDMDDVMLPSYSRLHRPAMNIALAKSFGFTLDDLPPNIEASLIGKPVIDFMVGAVEYMKKHNGVQASDIDKSKLHTDYKLTYRILISSVTETPMPGLQQSLDLFRSLMFRIALVTSGEENYVQKVIGALGIRDYLDAIVTKENSVRHKPHPDPYLKALELTQTPPERAVVLEDAEVGVISAKQANCYCIGIRNGYTPSQDLSAADTEIKSLEEITVELLERVLLPTGHL